MTATADIATGPSRQEQIETLGTALWLLMDFLWLVEWPWIGSAAGLLGLACHVIVFRYLPRDAATYAATGSAACWLLMNFCWMVGESYQQPPMIFSAKLIGGLAVTLLATSVWSGGIRGPVMQQFRRIKVWQGDD